MYKFHILTCVMLKPSVAGVVIAAVFSVASGIDEWLSATEMDFLL